MLRYFTHYRGYMIFENLSDNSYCPSFDTDMKCEALQEAWEAIDVFLSEQGERTAEACVEVEDVEISSSLRWYNRLDHYGSPEVLN